MGLFDNLFGRRDREIAELMNPLLAMKLKEFVIADDNTDYVKHYFRFRNKEGNDEEFIVNYRRLKSELEYLRTHWKRLSVDPEFRTLSERGPWSIAITYLIETGQRLSANTRPTRGHFASKVSTESLRDPNWVPPAAAEKPKVSPQPDVKKSPSATPPPPKREPMRVSVDVSEWQVQRKDTGIDGSQRSEEISQIYHISGMRGQNKTATLRVVCTVGCTLESRRDDQVNIHRRLRFYLWPFFLPREASFVMRLHTTDRSRGGTFDVLAAPVEGDADTALIAKYCGKDDVTKCLDAMMSGKEMTFMLADQKETLVDFLLPSDQAFKGLYDETCTRLAEFETGSELLRSGRITQKSSLIAKYSDQVRKSPKDHAVWMCETNPGEFDVLLVKLDSEGNMDEAWGLGTFSTRSEQGTFALEIARDFQIKLMDVVPTSTQDPNTSAPNELTYSVAEMDNQKFPPSHGTIWLDGDEIWLGQATKDFSFDGRSYHIPGSMVCFAREKAAREALLNVLRKERDLWAAGDEATAKARLIAHAEKLRG